MRVVWLNVANCWRTWLPTASSLLVYMYLLLAQILPGSTKSTDTYCYSCMPKSIQYHWRHLRPIYLKPANFTENCNEPVNVTRMGVRRCKSVCLTIAEPTHISGTYTGLIYIRGCVDNILRWGFRNKTISRFLHYDMCADVRQDDLFMSNINSQNLVQVCSCYGNLCNGARVNAAFLRDSATPIWLRLLWLGIWIALASLVEL